MNLAHLHRTDLNLLVVFAALMAESNTTRVGEKLFVTQSAVSHALKRLRELFNDPLFVRSKQNLVPTPAARQLWTALEPCLRELERLTSAKPGFSAATSERVFRLGLPSDLDIALTPLLLSELSALAPKINLVIRPTSFHDVQRQLDQDDVDLAMTFIGDLKPWLVRKPIAQAGYRCLWHPKQVLAKAPISLKHYLSVPHLLISFQGDRRGVVDEALDKLDQARRVLVASADFASVAMYLSSTKAIATLPEYAARRFASALGLSISKVPLSLPVIQLSAAWHSKNHNDPAHAWFREMMILIAKRM